MAISSVGIGSGLDVESIVTQMIALEKQPIKTLEAKAEVINSRISTYGQIKSLTDTLNAAVRDLTLDRTWNSVKISSSNTAAVNATMTGSAAAGSYNLDVKQLAQSQTSVSTGLDKTAKVGQGVMRFAIGDAANPSKVLDITVSSSDTLESLVGKINGHSDLSKQVIASVITGSDGKQQLMIRARETGTANAFSMQFGSNVGAGNVLEGTDDASAVALRDTLGFTQTQAAQNAEMTLNGVLLHSNSNNFADVIPGLTIAVSAEGKSLLNLTQDKDAIKDSIQKFVDAYNELNTLLGDSTKYNEESKVGGILQGDSSTVSLQNALRMLTQGVVGNADGAFNRLSDAGMQMQQGGKLTVNTTDLATALDDIASLKSMFATKASGQEQGGIAVRFKALTDELLAFDGTLNSKTDSLEDQLKRNQKEVGKVETRAETVEARLRKQYSALDVKMASLTSLSSYVDQMVASWNKSKD